MPTVAASRAASLRNRVKVSDPIQRVKNPVSMPTPVPYNLAQSTIMISSLPSIATNVDGVTRQFYGGRPLPTRRLILPS